MIGSCNCVKHFWSLHATENEDTRQPGGALGSYVDRNLSIQ